MSSKGPIHNGYGDRPRKHMPTDLALKAGYISLAKVWIFLPKENSLRDKTPKEHCSSRTISRGSSVC